MSSVTFDINLSRSRRVLTLRAAHHKLKEPMVASQMRLPQRFVERLAGSVPPPNRIYFRATSARLFGFPCGQSDRPNLATRQKPRDGPFLSGRLHHGHEAT